MYEIMMESNQMLNTEKYRIGIPNMAPPVLNIKIRGILNIKTRQIDTITNFCSCLFFIFYLNKI